MAKPIVVLFEGRESSFDHLKVERERLYGRRVRIPLDASGKPCERAAITDDGALVLRSGSISQGYFDAAGDWVPVGQLSGFDARGAAVPFVPSTLGVAQALEPIEPFVALELEIGSVHMLTPLSLDASLERALDAGVIFKFRFNYGSDYHAETAVLVRNDEGLFCLVGVPLKPSWSEPGQVPIIEEADFDGDLDFEMLLRKATHAPTHPRHQRAGQRR